MQPVSPIQYTEIRINDDRFIQNEMVVTEHSRPEVQSTDLTKGFEQTMSD